MAKAMPSALLIPAIDAAISQAGSLYYSHRDPERFMMGKLDLIRSLKAIREDVRRG